MSSLGRPPKGEPLKHVHGRLNVNVNPLVKSASQYVAASDGISFCAYVEKALNEMNTRYWRRVKNENNRSHIKERI
jgi:predicted HicB family RNase H-like nuclease